MVSSSPDHVPRERPLRILMLHGYGESGSHFRIKTQSLVKTLTSSFPGPFELIYPSGPLRLAPPTLTEVHSVADIQDAQYDHERAWWRGYLDITLPLVNLTSESFYACIFNAMQLLEMYAPVDGIIGFSSGACMAGIIAAICESSTSPSRQAALLRQKVPLQVTLPENQGPLKFIVCFAGFVFQPEDYGGFYDPPISTPSLHVRGVFDTMVWERTFEALYRSCSNAQQLSHTGGHFVSKQPSIESAVVRLVKETCLEADATPSPGQWRLAPEDEESSVDDFRTMKSGSDIPKTGFRRHRRLRYTLTRVG